ncbi:MAG: DUF1501 domain-containing protein [Planctomycetales bacterium]
MDPRVEFANNLTRRHLFGRAAGGIGAMALASLTSPNLFAGNKAANGNTLSDLQGVGGLPDLPHFAGKAKRVIYLFQSGGPSHIDLFDYKPQLRKFHGQELPESIRQGQRLTEMTHKQKEKPCVSTAFKFAQQGQSRMWLSELLPHTASIADEISLIRSIHTEAVNHDPGVTLMNTGTQQLGKPSFGSWLSYGIGSESKDLPAFVVMVSQGSGAKVSQPIFSRLWGTGFLPSEHQGVRFRSGKDPVLYLTDPPGLDRDSRRRMLDCLSKLNTLTSESHGDPETNARIAQYEMAFSMQTSVPDLMDLSSESEQTFELYGPESKKPGSYAANCLLARRLAERGVRFVQLYHRGWDQHSALPSGIRNQCRDTDQPTAGLIKDLKQRGMLDETVIVWGGEFGRTVYCQGKLTKESYGRDHHGRCYSMWLCGGGIRGGLVLGQTDDYCYNIVEDPIHIHDVNATILHCLGIHDKRLTYPFQGLDQRLTGVEEMGNLIKQIIA